MKKWKLTLLASASGVLLAGSAYAADLPLGGGPAAAIPYANWTGPYGGVQIGVASYQNTCAVGGTSYEAYACANGDSMNLGRDTGIVGGVRAGYDFQDRYFVYGVVADWDWTSLKTKTIGGSGSVSYESKVNWLASFRGRAGIALDANLIYVTGGLALGNFTENVKQGISDAQNSFTDTLPGWVAGVGFEHKFGRNWSVGAEYLHYDFTKVNHTYSAGGETYNHDFTHVVDAMKVNLNYRW